MGRLKNANSHGLTSGYQKRGLISIKDVGEWISMKSMFKSITIKSGQGELDTQSQETPKNAFKLRTPAEVYGTVVTLGSHCRHLN